MRTRCNIRIIFVLLLGMIFILGSCGGGSGSGSKQPPVPNPLDTWYFRASWDSIFDIAYGNGIFVAIAGSNFLTSSDGTSWTIRNLDTSTSIISADITYGDGIFVAMGYEGTAEGTGKFKYSIFTSPDGITWSHTTFEDVNYLRAIAYSNGIYVAVGENGTILTSVDRITWTQRNSGSTAALVTLTYGNGMFVAVGNAGAVLLSKDGIDWKKGDSGTSAFLSGISYGNGIYVIVGANGTILTSSDAIHWTNRIADVQYDFFGVTYGNDTFVVIGELREVSGSPRISGTSKDGITWTFSSVAEPFGLSILTYGNGIFLSCGWPARFFPHRPVITYVSNSPDGKSWTSKYLFTYYGELQDASIDISYGNGLFLGVGNRIVTSPDGVTWTIVGQDDRNGPSRIVYAEGLFVGVSGSFIFSSTDGKSWTTIDSGTSNYLSGITFGNGIYVAVGENGTILSSTDGKSWKMRYSDTSTVFFDVVFGKSSFIAAGDKIFQSDLL